MNRATLAFIALSFSASASACTKKTADSLSSGASPSATTPAPPPIDRSAYDRAIVGHESWKPSTDECPVKMSPLPPPKPGQNLGQLALEQGPREGRLNTNVVKSFADGKPLDGRGEAVDVLYVETERVEPALSDESTFTPGRSKGTAYVWDRSALRFACIARVDARSSPEVTSLRKDNLSATLWIAMDLMFNIERDIATNARAIATAEGPTIDASADASASDAGKAKKK